MIMLIDSGLRDTGVVANIQDRSSEAAVIQCVPIFS
jgi:hypothetical protein